MKCVHVACTSGFLELILTERYFQDCLLKGKQVKESSVKVIYKAWTFTKKWAKHGQKIAKQSKNKAFTFTANKLVILSGRVAHQGTKVFLKKCANRLSRGVTIEERGNTSQEVVIESSTRPSRKRNTNQVRTFCHQK